MNTLLPKPRMKRPSPAASRARDTAKKTVPKSLEQRADESRDAAPAVERAIFDWYFPNAKQVCVAGTFNDWQPAATPLHDCGGGRWILDIPLQPGRYEFRFVVDGQWSDDPGVTCRYLFVN
jgi:1,4-alpha-glucan branching enzyme